MNDKSATTPVKLQTDGDHSEVCGDCMGSGIGFEAVADSERANHRKQVVCALCGGSGKAADALARIFTGQATPGEHNHDYSPRASLPG